MQVSIFKHVGVAVFITFVLVAATSTALHVRTPDERRGHLAMPSTFADPAEIRQVLLSDNLTSDTCINEVRCPDCNVILLSVDSLRADHVGAYGYERNTTPFFDELAKKAALFKNYFSTSFLTPVSEMAVHTGMYPSANGVTNFDTILPKSRMTIGEYFKENGYATSALLSSPEFEINPALKESFSRGFERYEYATEPMRDTNFLRKFPSSEQVEKELEALGSQKFFWWVALGGVHWPYGEQGEDVFSDKTYAGVFKNQSLQWYGVFEKIFQGEHHASNVSLAESDIQYVRDQYDNGVRAFDEFLKTFIEILEQENLLRKTIIVIQSEHGEDLHEHGYFAHYDITDTQTHVPLLIISPKFQTGCRIASFAASVDVFPTIAQMIEHEHLRQFQGKGLAPIIQGDEKDGIRQQVLLERNPLWEETKAVMPALQGMGMTMDQGKNKDIGIRTPRWKYIERTSKNAMEKIQWWQAMSGTKMHFPEAELYNLAGDPEELINVIDQHPREAELLKQRLQMWFTAVTANSKPNVNTNPAIQPYF